MAQGPNEGIAVKETVETDQSSNMARGPNDGIAVMSGLPGVPQGKHCKGLFTLSDGDVTDVAK